MLMYVRKNLHLFPKKSDVHSLNTRNKNKLAVPNFRLHKVGDSFIGKCIRFFNKLPSTIKDLQNTLIRKGYYKVDDYLNDKSVWPQNCSALTSKELNL